MTLRDASPDRTPLAELAVPLFGPADSRATRRRQLTRLGRHLADAHAIGPSPDGARDLARALHALAAVTTRSERLRVLRACLDAGGVPAEQRAEWRDAFERQWSGLQHGARLVARRAPRDQDGIATDDSAGRALYWRTEFPRPWIDGILDAHAAQRRSRKGRFLKRSNRVVITRQAPDGAGMGFVVKENTDAGWRARLGARLFGSRGRRAWRGAQLLALHGFATPPAIALEERHRSGGVAESTLVTVALDDQVPLSEHFETHYRKRDLGPREIRAKRALLRRVARTLRRLHDAKLHHHDLSTRNLLVDGAAPGAIAILDLESLRRFAPRPHHRHCMNLAQILEVMGAGHWSDSSRFLREYGIRDAAERRRWLADVDRATEERLRRRRARARRAGRERDAGGSG